METSKQIEKMGKDVMTKETAAVAAGALLFSPLAVPVMLHAVPVILHGVAGLLVGGAGLFVVDSVVKQITDNIGGPPDQSRKDESVSTAKPEESF
ncbi:hypothetical protein [Chlorobium phaeobacteroides]|uniref:Uncharacterized protein n=1 Tax=Chlorobium phaeobacteroides (strain DSM 266 / SMG 266 / 2430) TaxID=290317 RepID=A1BGG3_CHLPD|nr:hypothetical protein [Chlorobium phaeobacteroides]ABL65490.1 hypothetical protein Cpha266_1462 [Chlorobium phaeobacteroides DSM 266]